MNDMVNRPPHYNQSDIECIDAIRAALGEDGFRAFCRGTAIKYAWRAGLKGDAIEDMAKCAWYSRMAAGDDPRHEAIELAPPPKEPCNHVRGWAASRRCINCNAYIGPYQGKEG